MMIIMMMLVIIAQFLSLIVISMMVNVQDIANLSLSHSTLPPAQLGAVVACRDMQQRWYNVIMEANGEVLQLQLQVGNCYSKRILK